MVPLTTHDKEPTFVRLLVLKSILLPLVVIEGVDTLEHVAVPTFVRPLVLKSIDVAKAELVSIEFAFNVEALTSVSEFAVIAPWHVMLLKLVKLLLLNDRFVPLTVLKLLHINVFDTLNSSDNFTSLYIFTVLPREDNLFSEKTPSSPN